MTTAVSPLLDLLFAPCAGLIELRAKPVDEVNGVPTCFIARIDAHGLTKFVGEHLHRHHLFFGVASRRDGSSGTLANCLELSALFVDLDFKHLPEPEARRRLYEFPFPPSAAVLSGGGLHVYWLLQEPLRLQGPTDCALARTLLRRLAHALGGDLVSAEPAHCLRLPGTVNLKYTPPRQVHVDHLAEELQYNASEFDEVLPAEPVETRPPGAFVAPAQIREGERNATLFRLGRSLKAKRLSHAAIRAALHAENQAKCPRPLSEREVDALVESAWTQADRPAPRDATRLTVGDSTPPAHEETAEPLFVDADAFLTVVHPPVEIYIDGLLSDEGGGWIAGEEKLGKTFYTLHEAACLALGLPVCGRFAVPTPRLILFIEEEDSPRRTQRRLRAILAGLGVDPDSATIRATLRERFHVSVWKRFRFDDPSMVARLDAELTQYHPAVCYVDVLRKVTRQDLNKADQAAEFLGCLDTLRRTHQVMFRLVAHNRKIQGSYRAGRGSQELAGSHQLGAWAENSLFFEPLGKKQGAVKVETQTKDLPPQPAFKLVIESEGPPHEPTLIRLRAEDLKTTSAAEERKETVSEMLVKLPPYDGPVKSGHPGVTVDQIAEALKCSDKTVRKALDLLMDEGRCLETGKISKGKKLYGVKP